jgi:hypothetical protein
MTSRTFEEKLIEAGYPLLRSPLVYDDRLHRFGKKGRYWYKASPERAVAGDHKRERPRVLWVRSNPGKYTHRMDNNLTEEIKNIQEREEGARIHEQLKIAQDVKKIYEGLSVEGHSPYLELKKLPPSEGLKFGHDHFGSFIAVPLKDLEGRLWNIRKIYNDGRKLFYKGARKKGCFLAIKGEDYSPENGACFEIHYEKARGFYGGEAKPFQVNLTANEGSLKWHAKSSQTESEHKELQGKIKHLSDEGYTQREIAEKLNINLTCVNRILKASGNQ